MKKFPPSAAVVRACFSSITDICKPCIVSISAVMMTCASPPTSSESDIPRFPTDTYGYTEQGSGSDIAVASTDSDSNAGGDSDSGSDLQQDTYFEDNTELFDPEYDLIYLLDTDRNLFKFYPPDKAFTPVGQINCDTGGALPYSMAVSRDHIAYVLYVTDYTDCGTCVGVFPVSIEDASCGPSIPFDCQYGSIARFGMGFATNGPHTTAETLYIGTNQNTSGISVCSAPTNRNTNILAALNTTTGEVTPLGDISGGPELTGTHRGELWGFFPKASPPFVAQLDKDTAERTVVWPLSGLPSSAGAWAFAHWGGSYYVFYEVESDSSTNVYKVVNGEMELYMENTGVDIVGADVSTRAPIVPVV